MDTTFMTAVIASSTTMTTSLIGSLFTVIEALLPYLAGLGVLGLFLGVISWIVRKIRHPVGRR